MLNTILKLFTLVFFGLMLNACGGESESVQSAGEKAVVEIDSLVAAEDFSFTTKDNIEVIVELDDYKEKRAYFSLYSEYQKLDSGRYYPESASRVMGKELQNGILNESFIGLNNQQLYLLEVWLYDGSEPLQKELSVNNNQLIWQ